MSKLITRLLVCVVTLAMVVAIAWMGWIGLRYDQIDKSILALKSDDGVEALKQLKPLAYLGDKYAQYTVGRIYAYGCGSIPKNDKDAIYWFRRAGLHVAEEGVDPAAPHALSVAKAYAVGGCGWKVETDHAESLKWLKFAAEGGSKEAAAILAQYHIDSKLPEDISCRKWSGY
jgi:TPR repeat protein